MKKLKYTLILGALVTAAVLAGCGGNYSNLKESSMYYSETQDRILLKKIDGAPKLGTTLEKSIPNGKWESEKKSDKEYIVYKGTLKIDEVKAIKDNLDRHDQSLNTLRANPYENLSSRFECDLDGNEYTIKFFFMEVDKDNFIPDSLEIRGDEKAGYDTAYLDQSFVLMELLEKENPEYDFKKDGIPIIYIPKELQEAAEKIQKLQNADKIVREIYPKKVLEIMDDVDTITANMIKEDKDYSNSKFENQEKFAKDSKSIDDALKDISDIDFGNSSVKEMLTDVLNKEKEIVDLMKDVIEKREGFSLPKDKKAFFDSIRESIIRVDKDCKDLNKMCGGGVVGYGGVLDYSGGLAPEYQKWCQQNAKEIEEIRNQVWR